jgi:hypothetical protein
VRGPAQPTYTEQRYAWLRQLLLRGEVDPKGTEWSKAAYSCRVLGWTDWVHGGMSAERLTDAGLEVLQRWDRGETLPPRKAVSPRGRPLGSNPGKGAPFESRIGYALKAGGLQALADWLVATKQVGELLKLLPETTGFFMPRYHVGGADGIPEDHAPKILDACTHGVPLGRVCDEPHARFVAGGPGQTGLKDGEVAALVTTVDFAGVATPELARSVARKHLPAWQRPCAAKLYDPPIVMREGAPTECDGNVPPDCEVVREIEAQAVRAPQFGIARGTNLRPSMGTAVGGYTQCESCGGRGSTRHGFQCHMCKGHGRLKRTVEL